MADYHAITFFFRSLQHAGLWATVGQGLTHLRAKAMHIRLLVRYVGAGVSGGQATLMAQTTSDHLSPLSWRSYGTTTHVTPDRCDT